MDEPTTAQRENDRLPAKRRQLRRYRMVVWWLVIVIVFACLLSPFLKFGVASWAITLAYLILTMIGVANLTGLDIAPVPVPKVTCIQWFALAVILLLIHFLFVAEATIKR